MKTEDKLILAGLPILLLITCVFTCWAAFRLIATGERGRSTDRRLEQWSQDVAAATRPLPPLQAQQLVNLLRGSLADQASHFRKSGHIARVLSLSFASLSILQLWVIQKVIRALSSPPSGPLNRSKATELAGDSSEENGIRK
jgi:hypothetical protein